MNSYNTLCVLLLYTDKRARTADETIAARLLAKCLVESYRNPGEEGLVRMGQRVQTGT